MLLVSQPDKGSSAAWLSSALHTISPLFTISPFSILLHLPPWWSNSQCASLFLFPSHRCQQYCIHHSLSSSVLLSLMLQRKLYGAALFSSRKYQEYSCFFSPYSFYSRAVSLSNIVFSRILVFLPHVLLLFSTVIWQVQQVIVILSSTCPVFSRVVAS